MHPPEHAILTTLGEKRRNKKYAHVFFLQEIFRRAFVWDCETETKFEHAYKEHGFGKAYSNDLV